MNCGVFHREEEDGRGMDAEKDREKFKCSLLDLLKDWVSGWESGLDLCMQEPSSLQPQS